MANYSAQRTIINASLEELIEIFRWVHPREKKEKYPVTVLVGGWAVYSYNQWYGSVDIDLVTNNKTRQSLVWYLRNKRAFFPQRDEMAPATVVKNAQEGKIMIDFGSREDIYRFEGRCEECPFSLLDGRTATRDIGAGFPVVVPERTLLMIYKLKASWDRSFRILNGTSSDEEWERGKLRKDRADILALLDPAAGGTEIDLQYLGDRLHEFPFLVEMLQEIPDDNDAIRMYHRMKQKDVQGFMDGLLQLVLDERK